MTSQRAALPRCGINRHDKQSDVSDPGRTPLIALSCGPIANLCDAVVLRTGQTGHMRVDHAHEFIEVAK